MFNYGLMVLEWALNENKQGKSLVSIPHNQVIHQIKVMCLPGINLVTSI